MTAETGLSLESVLDLEYLSQWDWSPAGDCLACILDHGGVGTLWILDRFASAREAVTGEINVSSFDWHPDGRKIVFAAEGSLYMAERSEAGWTQYRLTETAADEQVPRFSPAGDHIAFIRDEALWLWNLEGGTQSSCAPPEGKVVASGFPVEEGLVWNPSGTLIAFHFADSTLAQHIALCDLTGEILWRSNDRAAASGALSWMDERSLLTVTCRDRNTVAEFRTLRFSGSQGPKKVPETEVIHIERALGTPGSLRAAGAWPEPGGDRILFRGEADGWAHLYLYDRTTKRMRQMTFGEGEDMGYVGDVPVWAPDGRYVCYASNLEGHGERQLWLLDADEESALPLTEIPGTNVSPRWSPDGSPTLAFVHCDSRRSADLWVLDVPMRAWIGEARIVEGSSTKQLTRTQPDSWPDELSIEPEEVEYRGAGGLSITGYLMKPPGLDEGSGKTYPALVWVHGGPVRQMRPGFHPSRSYAFFHAFSQYLAHRGYITLAINFRGGIGYGREFRNALFRKMGVDDVADVVAGGRYLKSLPYVDEEKVAVWGLSYGGYMTLTALTKYPDEFAMGINVAGVYDFVQWTHWIQRAKGPWTGNFSVFFDGDPEDNPDTYFAGSPCNYIEDMTKPLVSLHGTADRNVDFAQMDRIVKDCLRLEKVHDAHYYPDEAHMFTRRDTWKDALRRIEESFDARLGDS